MKPIWMVGLGLFGIALPLRAAEPLRPEPTAQRIEQLRTRTVVVQVLDRNRQPLANAPVRAEMLRHQFLFGCNLYLFGKFSTPEENRRYEELWSGLFNYATAPFYLGEYRPTADGNEEPRLREMVRWARERGVVVKGHPLVWHFPGTVPDWLPAEPAAIEALEREHVPAVVRAFPEIAYWDVVNEPTTVWMYNNPIARWENQAGPLAATQQALEWAGAANGSAQLLVNDYNVRFGLWSWLSLFHPVRIVKGIFDGVANYPLSYHQFLSDLQRGGGKFQAIGIQSHMHMGNWPFTQVWRTCERYADLGVPLHFTEVTVLSGTHKIMNPFNPKWNLPWPSTPRGEREQADYAAAFYTLLFSHPAVQAITWWDLTDREAWMGAPAGLLRADLSPKPAYERLRKLIREQWWTNWSGETDAQGRLSFRGYCGDYRLHLAGQAEPVEFKIDCAAGGEQKVELTVQARNSHKP